jgi:TPP-dependent pyruvate/acetoin dehydrogenase alpha subunit
MTTNNKELAPSNDGFSLISNQKLLALYAAMQECRGIAERSRIQPKKSRPAGSINSILGHEAAVVAATIDLINGDSIAPDLWPNAAFKTINPSVSFASSISLATRMAAANKARRNIVILFSGSERSQASWLRALNLAAAQSLPMLFVSFDRRQSSGPSIEIPYIPRKPRGYALPSISVDGNDVVAVYRVASEAIAHARKGHGPTLIECLVLNPSDPIHNMMKYLIRKGLAPRQTDGPPNDKVSEWA